MPYLSSLHVGNKFVYNDSKQVRPPIPHFQGRAEHGCSLTMQGKVLQKRHFVPL